jgi:CRP/FNR family cyclic AMP-dependent transcriptional regulator
VKKVLYILGLLEDRDIDWMTSVGTKVALRPGQKLVEEGIHAGAVSIVIDGTLDVAIGGRTLATVGSGEIVGEISLLDSRPPSATVIAGAPSHVLSISIHDMKAHLASDPGFAGRFYHALAVFLAQRLRRNNLQLMVGNGKDVVIDQDQMDEMDEIDPDVLEQITLAGNRFQMIMAKLHEA